MHDMQIQAGAPLITSPSPNESAAAPSRPRRLLYLALVIVAVPVYVADQLTKAWATASLQPDQPRELIGSVLQLNLIRNSGAAFSIGTGATWILTLIACSVVVFILISVRRLGSRGWALALGLLLAGSLGNLTDRMFRAPGPGRGHVVDFLQLPHYPIFNIADSVIVSAAILIAVLAFRGISIDGTRASGGRTGKHEKHDEHQKPDQHQKPESTTAQPAEQQPPQNPAGPDHDA
ncbi:MAG TPA: signal peptidase II [Dermatophilaceae bacterium]|nr:signal peptidase II [Dermatophilaceae bacterium]